MAILGDDCRNEGKCTVIKCEDISGPFETNGDALKAAYEQYDLWPFLVRRIEQNERHSTSHATYVDGIVGKMMRRWLLALSLPVLVLAMVFLAVRPSPYGEWLGLAGLNQETPALVIREWANRRRGPRTLLGFLSLFPADDVLIAGALLVAMVIVLVLLWNPARTGQPGSG